MSYPTFPTISNNICRNITARTEGLMAMDTPWYLRMWGRQRTSLTFTNRRASCGRSRRLLGNLTSSTMMSAPATYWFDPTMVVLASLIGDERISNSEGDFLLSSSF